VKKLALALVVMLAACAKDPEKTGGGESNVPAVPATAIPGHESLSQDTTVKEGPRVLAAEVYMRSYLMLFGGLAPVPAQTALRAKDGALFDAWKDYLAALGLPDYRNEIGRSTQTNALMVATFERIGVALCEAAVEKELKDTARPPVDKRIIYPFEVTAESNEAEFTTRFDVMHRTFLGYPASEAATDRTKRFFALYNETIARHKDKTTPTPTRFTPAQAGWATVCMGLVRHPEFHVY
jgi:hypothetical protein